MQPFPLIWHDLALGMNSKSTILIVMLNSFSYSALFKNYICIWVEVLYNVGFGSQAEAAVFIQMYCLLFCFFSKPKPQLVFIMWKRQILLPQEKKKKQTYFQRLWNVVTAHFAKHDGDHSGEVAMCPRCSQLSLLPWISMLIPVLLAKCPEWYPLYSNRGFILHVNPTNLGFGRLTWFRGFRKKVGQATVAANNEAHLRCFVHVCSGVRRGGNLKDAFEVQIKDIGPSSVKAQGGLILQHLHHLSKTLHQCLTTSGRDSPWSGTMMQGKHLNPSHNGIGLLNTTAFNHQRLFRTVFFPPHCFPWSPICTKRLLPFISRLLTGL